MSKFGYSGLGYDRHVEHQDNTTIGKMKERYWIAKQLVRKRLGKKEDDCVIFCDAELDAKLETFQAIATSCIDLLQIIEDFQENVADLAEEENSFGKFIQEQAKLDHTRAGKIMSIFGKSQLLSSYHRIQLQTPLQRMYQDICTFHQRAVKDTFETIEKMEKARLQYRAALLWMKDISQNLDPDTFRQLEKFRKVQSQVKMTRTRFERLKFDSIQKIDLLAASRCNMFSNSLVGYQNLLIQYWGNTARVLRKVSKTFNGYQFYEFNKLKQLTEISRKLASEFATAEGYTLETGDDDITQFYEGGGGTEGEDDPNEDGSTKLSQIETTSRLKNDGMDDEELLGIEADDLLPGMETGYDAMMELAEVDLMLNKDHSNHSINGIDDSTADQRYLLRPQMPFLIPGKGNESRDKTTSALIDSDRGIDLKMGLVQDVSPEGRIDRFSGADMGDLRALMPSHLLDTPPLALNQEIEPTIPARDLAGGSKHLIDDKRNRAPTKSLSSSSWLDKFADLDPLANPDLVGYVGKESDILDRNC